MKNKPSILIVSSWYPSHENTTEGTFVHEQVKMLQKNGHEVTVVKPNLNGSFIETLKGKKVKNRIYRFDQVEVFEVGVNVYVPKIKRLYYEILTKSALKVIKKSRIQFDIIHSHALLSAGIIAPSISSYFKKPLVHTEHTSGLIFAPNQFSELDKISIKNLIIGAQKILFVSKFARNNSLIYKDFDDLKIEVLYNIVEDTFFKIPFVQKKNQVISIGDFSERKNQIFLVSVWKMYLKRNPTSDYRLIFAGNGFDNSLFVNEIEGISSIVIMPRLNRNEVLETISQSKVLFSASKLETFGLTIAESLALGTPVVVTDSGGPKEIVKKGDGFIVDLNNDQLFLDKFEEVINGIHDFPSTIRERCKFRFSERVIYDSLNEIYSNLDS